MLKGRLIHPQILSVLGRSGHGSKVLIADGNYPFGTTLGPNAQLVSLNLSPGMVGCVPVLEALVTCIPIEAAAVMQYDTTGPHARKSDPPIWGDYRRVLRGLDCEPTWQAIERFKFYEVAAQPDVALTIATGEQRTWANLLLTIGVVTQAGD